MYHSLDKIRDRATSGDEVEYLNAEGRTFIRFKKVRKQSASEAIELYNNGLMNMHVFTAAALWIENADKLDDSDIYVLRYRLQAK